MKTVNFLNVTLNPTAGKCQPYNNSFYIKILSNYSSNLITNLPSNVSKKVSNSSVDEAAFNKSKGYTNARKGI